MFPIYLADVSIAWATAEGGFYPRLWILQAVSGECRGGWPQTSVCQRRVTHVSHGVTLSSKPVACNMWYDSDLKKKKKKSSKEKAADILHSWAHSTKYNNFLEFFDPRRRSQGTSCCPRSTSCSCGSISLPRCHGHWKTLYSCLIGTLPVGLCWHRMYSVSACSFFSVKLHDVRLSEIFKPKASFPKFSPRYPRYVEVSLETLGSGVTGI